MDDVSMETMLDLSHIKRETKEHLTRVYGALTATAGAAALGTQTYSLFLANVVGIINLCLDAFRWLLNHGEEGTNAFNLFTLFLNHPTKIPRNFTFHYNPCLFTINNINSRLFLYSNCMVNKVSFIFVSSFSSSFSFFSLETIWWDWILDFSHAF